jgi:NADH-quinone oxidoreductase subunit L
MPITFITFLLATIAIAGVPGFAGFWSKDAVLAAALAFGMTDGHYLPFIFALCAAAITAFYMFRIVILTFMGKPRDHHLHEHAHENKFAITMPLVVLASLAVVAGGNEWLGLTWFERFVSESTPSVEHARGIETPQHDSVFSALAADAHAAEPPTSDPHAAEPVLTAPHDSIAVAGEAHADEPGDHAAAGTAHGDEHHDVHHTAHVRAMWLSILAAGLGILLSFLTYHWRKISSAGVQAVLPGAHRVLSHKYYCDEINAAVPVRGNLKLAKLSGAFDKLIIDGIVNGTGHITRASGWLVGQHDRWIIDGLVNATGEVLRSIGAFVGSLQTGRVQNYYLGLVSGLVILILVYRVAFSS